MKQNTNLYFAALALTTILSVGLACNSFSASKSGNNTNEYKPTGTAPEAEKPRIEKADFTVTAEEYDQEFTKKGAKAEDLKKYAGKTIAVTGRVSLLSLEKKGATPPWVALFAPGVMNGVSCYFDDDNLEQMKRLKMDKVVTVQGYQDTFIVPEVSPRLEHCVVIKAD